MKMSSKAREASNAYKREWARKNPEKIKAAQEKYWLKKALQAGNINIEQVKE